MSAGKDAARDAASKASRFGSRVVDALEHRLELFGIELTEEKLRLLGLLVGSIVAALAMFVGFLTLNVLLAFLFWEQRVPLFGALTALYLGGGIVLALVIRSKVLGGPPPFAMTIEELKRDARMFRKEAGDV